MTQQTYDVVKFLVENKKELLVLAEDNVKDIKKFQSLFDTNPKIYEEFYMEALQRWLIFHLIPIFNSDFEQLSDIITTSLIRILYED